VILAWRNETLLRQCLASLATNISAEVSFETVIVANRPTVEVRSLVEEEVSGARVVWSPVNLGFAGGCNRGRMVARGEFIVLLNDDAEVSEGWLESLVATADAHPEAGAVGGLIRFPDGSVQEAGCVLWSDGSTLPLGRGLPATSHQHAFVRRVPYCSACCLLVRATTWDAAGGMDEAYFPGYYEDVDLCLAIQQLGQAVLYDPNACVLHHESASLDLRYKHFVFARGQARFRQKWAHRLETFPVPEPVSPDAVRRAAHLARGLAHRVLVIDDRLPDPGAGSGFGRMFDTVAALASDRFAVAVWASDVAIGDQAGLARLGIEIIDDDIESHLADGVLLYDVVIISRPNNFERYADLIRSAQPQACLIYDAEALYHRRLQRQAALAEDELARAKIAPELDRYRALEHRIAVEADQVVCISADEASTLGEVPGHAPVAVFSPRTSPHRIGDAGFRERADIMMVAGWLSGADSPNGDGLLWFARHVLPIVRADIPWVRLRVTGARPPGGLGHLAGPAVEFTGYVEDLDALYDRTRVAIAPIRYGAGVKIKTIEALEHGVPIVTTHVGAEGIGDPMRAALRITDDAREFAAHLVTLLNDRPAWDAQRAAIVSAVGSVEAADGQAPGPSWPELVRAACRRRAEARGLLPAL